MRRPGGGSGLLLGVIIIVAVAAAAGLPGLGERDFWPQDEARYGTVALEMWNGAHPAVPHLNGKIYQDKPPGYFWLVNLAARIRGGVDEWAARAPSVLGSALLALGAFFLLAPAGGWTAGLLAGLVSLASWLVMWEARQAHLDVLFGGFIALGMAAFTRALEPGRERWAFLGHFLIGCAILVKGPLALIAVAMFAVASLLVRRPRAFFNFALLPGLLMMLLPTLFWLGWAYFHLNGVKENAGLDYVRGMWRQVEDRVDDSAPAHDQPWYYYFKQLAIGLLPFLPVVFFALARGVRKTLGPMRPAFVVAACWLVGSFVIQSAFPGKRALYMVPLVAPFAVLVGAIVHAQSRAAATFAAGWAALIGCGVFIAGGALVAAGIDDWTFEEGRKLGDRALVAKLVKDEMRSAEGPRPDRAAAEAVARERIEQLDWAAVRRGALIAGIAALVLSAIALTSLALGEFRTGMAWSAVAIAIMVGLALGYVLPALDVIASRRPVVVTAVAAAGGPRAPIGYLRHLDEAFPFYAGRPVTELFLNPPRTEQDKRSFRTAASEFLKQKGSVLVVRADDYANLSLRDVSTGPVMGPLRAGSKQWYLLRGAP